MTMIWSKRSLNRPVAIALLAGLIPLGASRTWAEPPPLSSLSFLPGDAVSAPGAGRQLSPEIAAGDGQYLLVWVDERGSNVDIVTYTGGPTYNPYAGSKWDIYAARIDLAGNLIDETPIVVCQELKNQAEPDVAWNGENWLVVWSGQAGLECCADENIYAARVSPTGQVLDVPSIIVDLDTGNSGLRWPTVGSDGTNWVVAWRDLDGGIFTIDGTRVAPDGTLLDPGGVFLRHDTSNSYPVQPDIVWAGDEYLLVWEEGSGGVSAQRLTAGLAMIGTDFTINATYWVGFDPKVATDGTDFFVTWRSEPPGQTTELAGARVTHGGVVLDPSPLLLTAATNDWIVDPAVAWDGTNWVVAYGRGDNPLVEIYAIRVTPAGIILDYDTAAFPVTAAPELQWETTIAGVPGGGGTFVAWRDHRHTPTIYGAHGDIFGTTFAPDGTVGAKACVALGAPRQTLLKLLPSASGYLAVYRSETSPETRILAQRLDSSGNAIDLEPVVVAASERGLTNPSAAWNGSVYFVVWEDKFANRTYGRRFDPNLSPIDAMPMDVMPGNTPDVAAIGDLFLTVTSWEEPHEVRGAYSVRVRASDGAILDTSPRLFSSGYALFPSVAAFGDQWLTAWESHPTHDDPSSTAKANFVDQNGFAGGWSYVDLDATRPVVASGPDHAIVAFAGDTGPGFNDDIDARRILPNGTFLDPERGIKVTQVLDPQHEPAVAWDGTQYVTAFADLRDSDADGSFMGELYGARISAAGVVLDLDGFPIANDAIPEMFPAVAGTGSEFILGGSVFRPEAGYANYRIGLRSSGAAVGAPPDQAIGLVSGYLHVSPNPSPDGRLAIDFQIPGTPTELELAIYDVTGRRLRTLYRGASPQARGHVNWNGRNGRGTPVAAGTYFARLTGRNGISEVRRITILR
jgi:hypothetical protein